MTRRLMPLLVLLAMLVLVGLTAPARAANYVFPGSPAPAGCSGTGGTYTCGSVTLGNSDTVTIGTPRPATLTINGNLDVGRSTINATGLASDLSVTVTGTLTVGNSGQVNGNVTAASVTNPGGRANIGGSLTATGAISLGNSASVAQCVRSSTSAAITLGNGSTVGGVCCGALGACTSTCVVNNSGSAMPALCSGGPAAPARFNAFETGTAAGSTSGVIKTKVSGSTITVAVAAINSGGSTIATGFTGSVRVEVLDTRTNTGTLDTTTNCRAGWGVASGTSAVTLTFAAADQGRKNVSFTVGEAFADARVRIVYPATGTPTVTGCSTDNFAIRPANFGNLSITDFTSSTPANGTGTPRSLTNTGITGGVVHKAGQPFTVRATALNSAGTATANYAGTVTARAPTACTGTACTATLGTLALSGTVASGSSGQFVTHTASYSEAGAFNLQLVDSSFAAVDTNDGSTTTEREITSSVVAVGRFVPDHFTLVSTVTPTLLTFNSSTCATRSFTYYGQPFGYATPPRARVEARNAAEVITVNYPTARLTGSGMVRTPTYTIDTSVVPAAAVSSTSSAATNPPTLSASLPGTATLDAYAAELLTVARPATTPLPLFNANISLAWTASDQSETAVTGNQSIDTATPLTFPNIAFDSPSGAGEFRYGQLKIGSAYGSELIPLAVPVETQYWNGTSFVTNAADQCTSLPVSSLSFAGFGGGLAACETAPSGTSVTMASGRAVMRLQAPGTGNAGSVDGTVQLGASLVPTTAVRCAAIGGATAAAVPAALPWLQVRAPGGTSYNQNPSARFSFGQYRTPLIQLREVY